MSGGVYNVTITNIQFKASLYTLRIKSGRGRGGYVKDVYVSNCTLIETPMAVSINMKYANSDADSEGIYQSI
jgi:polygalacturonase